MKKSTVLSPSKNPNAQAIGRASRSRFAFTLTPIFKQYCMRCCYHLYTIWLFTLSDLKTIIFPSTAFGILNALALSPLNTSESPTTPYREIVGKTPLVLAWNWINLLPFAINNQRQPDAIKEDLLNKPWRSMPSGRISPKNVKYLMLTLYLFAILTSKCLANLTQCFLLIGLGYWYNNLHGADTNCLVRNGINACGFVCFISGSMQVAIGRNQAIPEMFVWWYFVIAGIVLSTVQIQDMYDQRGDAIRHRRTVPLVVGDGLARWSIAIPMVFWCWFTPWIWRSSFLGYILPSLIGLTTAFRILMERTEAADKLTFRLWNLWMVSIYMLPLIKACENFVLL